MGRLPHFLDDRAAPSYVSLICSPWPTPPSALASSVSHSYLPSFALSLPAFPSPLTIFMWISSLFTITLLSQASLPLSFASLPLSFISLLLSFTSLSLSFISLLLSFTLLSLSFTSLSLSLTSQTPLLSSPPSRRPSSLSFTLWTPSQPALTLHTLSSLSLTSSTSSSPPLSLWTSPLTISWSWLISSCPFVWSALPSFLFALASPSINLSISACCIQ